MGSRTGQRPPRWRDGGLAAPLPPCPQILPQHRPDNSGAGPLGGVESGSQGSWPASARCGTPVLHIARNGEGGRMRGAAGGNRQRARSRHVQLEARCMLQLPQTAAREGETAHSKVLSARYDEPTERIRRRPGHTWQHPCRRRRQAFPGCSSPFQHFPSR